MQKTGFSWSIVEQVNGAAGTGRAGPLLWALWHHSTGLLMYFEGRMFWGFAPEWTLGNTCESGITGLCTPWCPRNLCWAGFHFACWTHNFLFSSPDLWLEATNYGYSSPCQSQKWSRVLSLVWKSPAGIGAGYPQLLYVAVWGDIVLCLTELP